MPQPKQLKTVHLTVGIILPRGDSKVEDTRNVPGLWTVSGLEQSIGLLQSLMQDQKSICHPKRTLHICSLTL